MLSKGVTLYEYQIDAVNKMQNGCILNGGVGSGKSRTSLGYFYKSYGGRFNTPQYIDMTNPPNLYIITTARKRDTGEWEDELHPFRMSIHPDKNLYSNKVVIDSWNNVKKYADVKDSFFIFDEQRVVGSGTWVKAFLKITKRNQWMLLSATPGDTWTDYIPVFIANGFYKNKTQFENMHCVFNPYTKFKQVDHYVNEGRLLFFRRQILVNMDFDRPTIAHHERITVGYDRNRYKEINKTRWDFENNQPIQNASALCYILRKLVNSDESRQVTVAELFEEHPKCIVFYNFDYERDILLGLFVGMGATVAEWSGHAHESVPTGESWAYLVQYTAGCEGWNCITTDTIIFYSQNYSYKVMEQAAGRIDRLNTPFRDLYYYHLKSSAPIDLAIAKALNQKKRFNESGFVRKLG